MKALQKKLEHREKTELIAILQQMLRQEPDLQWLLTTPLPTASSPKVSLDPDALSINKETTWGASQHYAILLAKLGKRC